MLYQVLEKYLPNPESLEFIQKWLEPYSVQIKITKGRKGKLGDYRNLNKDFKHKITINYNLPKNLFFFTLTHEIAHMMIYDKFKMRTVSPHGKEWKLVFGNLILESIEVYPADLQRLLKKFAMNPKAGYYGDAEIAAYFAKKSNPNQMLLLNLNEGMSFSIENTAYLLLKKNRTRYLCKNLSNQKKYLINHSVSVKKLTKNES